MRLQRPPPLCDCCNPPTWYERIFWRIRERLHRLIHGPVKVEFKTFVPPIINKPWPKLNVEDICSNSVKGDGKD